MLVAFRTKSHVEHPWARLETVLNEKAETLRFDLRRASLELDVSSYIDETMWISSGAVENQVVRNLVGADDSISIGIEVLVEFLPPWVVIDGSNEAVIVARDKGIETDSGEVSFGELSGGGPGQVRR